jgi:5-carboxymethyl-2-hydroxymuconate isomerase
MPHLTVQYSQNLDQNCDMYAFCSVMSVAMQETGVFPYGGHKGAGASDAALFRR